MLKNISFFILMNASVMLSLYLVIFVLGLLGISFSTTTIYGLFIFSLFVGFSGSFISLFLSKWMVKKTMGIYITNNKNDTLYKLVEELSKEVGIKTPEVGIYEGQANAFATGWSKNHALVAVSTGLLNNLDYNEIKGVIAHEIGHIVNGDMVSMTLIEGILNTFVFFFADLIAKIVANEEENGFIYFGLSFILQIVFGIFATMIAMSYSRYREYKADEVSVKLNGKEGIYNALYKLANITKYSLPQKIKAFGIVGFVFSSLFASHPPIEKRLKHIENL